MRIKLYEQQKNIVELVDEVEVEVVEVDLVSKQLNLNFLTDTLDPLQHLDIQNLELSTIDNNKSSDIFGIEIILWVISNGNSPFEMIAGKLAKNHSEIIITPSVETYNVIDVKVENINENFYQSGIGTVAYCYDNEEKTFELYLKSAEKGYLALFNVGIRNTFKWYLKAAEKELNTAQHNLEIDGIIRKHLNGFPSISEWFQCCTVYRIPVFQRYPVFQCTPGYPMFQCCQKF
ncbi:hypothetical protein Glove_59g67 [Diversispora epigaea]|uniref:Uncharacterized protein n=1 Tax=Diversispora epigaea TaxID=1348612 RepID=A0A397JCQ0_9GLOM|nr:hypothetical protein Glove_59g67 [Diversispora epigaea]